MRRDVWLAIFLVMIFPALLFTVSCAKEVTQTQPAATAQPEPPVDRAAQTTAPATPASGQDSADTAATAFSNGHVHFDFDSALLSDQARRIVADKADYLRAHPAVSVTLEGHCDERGTEAYNMALGQRRAESVKQFLKNLGIAGDRLTTLSYGEERPLETGRSEMAWATNRRVQFVID